MKDFGRVFAVVSVWVCSIFCPLCGLHVNTQTVVEKKLSNNSNNNTDSVAAQFYWFREQFHRQYDTNDEFNMRFLHFREATKRHTYRNLFSTATHSAKYGVNQFSDLSQDEFRDVYLRANTDTVPLFSGQKTEGLPAKFDWRDKAVVAPVQNQQACGSCWAFSVVGAVQSAHAIAGSPLQQLSVQQVVDCSYKNEGCGGGSPTRALSWLKQTHVKLVANFEYPYKAKTGICHFFSQSHNGVSVRSFTAQNFSGQEAAMMGQLLECGPLAAIVDAVSWQDYQGGIIQHHCSSQHSNHAVLIVGYDTTDNLLVGVFTAAVGAVAALSHVQKCVNVGIQLGNPVVRHQERCQVEKVHKHLVAVTKNT
uniref:Cathepsin O n=1 Tax=Cynoglossus semilaevis TaxID=244447 RepID=A0A3P8UU44_CYNSE